MEPGNALYARHGTRGVWPRPFAPSISLPERASGAPQHSQSRTKYQISRVFSACHHVQFSKMNTKLAQGSMKPTSRKRGGMMTMREFRAWFGDEQQCGQQLRRQRWPKGIASARCAGSSHGYLPARQMHECAVWLNRTRAACAQVPTDRAGIPSRPKPLQVVVTGIK